MKAVIIHATGDADVLRLEEVERPQPCEDEVLITVQADAAVGQDWPRNHAQPRSESKPTRPNAGRKGAHVATDSPRRSVLLIGKSQLVLDGALAGLRDLGYEAEATNDFADITARFDARETTVVRRTRSRRLTGPRKISAVNPRVISRTG